MSGSQILFCKQSDLTSAQYLQNSLGPVVAVGAPDAHLCIGPRLWPVVQPLIPGRPTQSTTVFHSSRRERRIRC